MKSRAREIIEHGDRLFADRAPLLNVWQEFALQFYPERADFTTQRSLSTEFASHLVTGQPAMARRDMANTLSAMLRPRGQPWFHGVTNDEGINKDPTCKKWLEWATEIQRKFMYENAAKLLRSTKEADNDFVTFGQAVLEVRYNSRYDGIIYICHHLRDVVWQENADLEIDHVHRNGKFRPDQIMQLWGTKDRKRHSGCMGVSHKITDAMDKDPGRKFKTRHLVMPRDQYDLKDSADEKKRPGSRLPFVSIHVDVENEYIMEEVGAHSIDYIIPRWQTVSGTQYAHSPATVIAISDARMLQQISLTLLEAGQKSVDPPMLAVMEAIQGGVNTFAGGITAIDAEYDERLGEALRPLTIDRGGFTWGDNLQERITNTIKEAFYLNQISMPDTTGEMTAYEVQKRFEEYIRRALPLFEPMETEYNGALCDKTFELLLRTKVAFGDLTQMPQAMRGQEIKFSFSSPLQQAQNRANSQAFMESAKLLQIAVQMDPKTKYILDVNTATRDALEGAQVPASWFNTAEFVEQAAGHEAQQQQVMQAAQSIATGANVAGQVGEAAGKLRDGLQPAQGGQGQPMPAQGGGEAPPDLAALMASLHGGQGAAAA